MSRIIADRFAFADEPPREGGFSQVHRAVDLRTTPPREVAVKLLSPSAAEDHLIELFFNREVDSLLSLEHPNIVELLDAGREETGEHYLVLEWVNEDLPGRLSGAIPGFDDFVSTIALPLASALSFAHERSIVHRDVKPTNVLVTPEGYPKLADFGISKLKSSLTASPHTAAEFLSRPFSPPEKDSTSAFSRDVFGFGVLMLDCLSPEDIKDYPDIEKALASLDVSRELEDLIGACVSLRPEDRPRDATVLHAQLASLHEKRTRRWEELTKVYIDLTPVASRTLTEAVPSGTDLREFLINDLSDEPCVEEVPAKNSDDTQRWFNLYGASFSYRATAREQGREVPGLVLVGALPLNPGRADQARRRHAILTGFEFTTSPPLNHARASNALQELLSSVDEHRLQAAADEEARERERLFEQWRSQISAREEIESRRELPLPYTRAEREGRRGIFHTKSDTSIVEVGQLRRVAVRQMRLPRPVRGEVEEVRENSVVLYLEEGAEGIPRTGDLVIDTTAARVKIDRERRALSSLVFDSAEVVRSDLKELIIDPTRVKPPAPVNVSAWRFPDIDMDKAAAVERALGAPDLFLVQGPPGTGKTTFIAELIAQVIEKQPNARILVSSQTNVALDNALIRLHQQNPSLQLVRLADAQASKVAPEAEEFLLAHQLRKWRKSVSSTSRQFLQRWCADRGVDAQTVMTALRIEELAESRRYQARLHAELADIEKRATSESGLDADDEERSETLRRELDRITSDATDLQEQLSEVLKQHGIRDLDPPDVLTAAATALVSDGGDYVGELRNVVQLQAAWLERLSAASDFIPTLLRGSHVLGGTCVGLARYPTLRTAVFDVCIIDECSRATATETLVPMVRARRWVLVGDEKQLPPFQEEALKSREIIEEFQLDEQELERSLFERFADGLPQEAKAMLTTQHRMTEAVGNLISTCFYAGKLVHRGPEPLKAVPSTLPRPVTWLSTSRLPNHFERVDPGDHPSYVNLEEARQVLGALQRLDWFLSRSESSENHIEVLVIAPYRAQIAQLRRTVGREGRQLHQLSIEVNTVDAVQGREADLVVFSVTRSNAQGNLGFLNREARANVALSRAKRGLIVVGDATFCGLQPGPLASVLQHIRRHPTECHLLELQP